MLQTLKEQAHTRACRNQRISQREEIMEQLEA